jgi:hypothetical protein
VRGFRLESFPMIFSRTIRAMILGLAGVALIGTSAAVPPPRAEAATLPGDLLVFSGWPSHINRATTVAEAAADFGRYDFVVLGGGIEDPSHPDHARTKAVLAHPAMAGTRVFGYVNLGVTNGELTLAEVRRRVDLWQAVGADGIQLDAIGYDWGVTRARQNAAIEYVHSLGMPVVANGWFADDVFGDDVDPTYNPSGTPTLLGASDFYMSESYYVRLGEYQNYADWYPKAEKIAAYQAQLGFSVLSVTTNNSADVFSSELFGAAWNAAAEYGHVAIGWGEYLFSADDNQAPYRPRPAASGEPQVVCDNRAVTIIGTPGPDRLVGTEHPDVIAGLPGADVILGAGGNDRICGGGGNDRISGGDGRDRLFGGVGADRLFGDRGNDRLFGQGGNDFLPGGPGIDRARGGRGVDTCDAEYTFTCEA